MKHFINFVFRYFLPILSILLALLRFFFPDFIIYFYGWAYFNWILAAIISLFIVLSFYGWYSSLRQRSREFKKNFRVYKKINKLTPSDFGIFNYYETYIHRESDTEAEKSLKEKGIAFITGKPRIGKTRGAFEVAKKFKDFYILKPANEKIDIQNLKFPQWFSQRKIILFLDDLHKYAGRFGLDELIAVLRKNSKELKVLATCRTGKEFDQVFGQKEMAILLSLCQSNKVEPRILKEDEERELAEGIGKKWAEVTSDGTPGSIVLGLDQMLKRYKDLGKELKIILCVLKLLREARIFIWTEGIIKNISKSKIFNLEGIPYDWENWLRNLQENGFIEKTPNLIRISHDSYLDNEFMTECQISNETLIMLKNELFYLKDFENLFYLGNSFYDRKNLEEGVDCYNKSIKINPDFVESHYNLGVLLDKLKNYPEAEKEYRIAIKINPGLADVHYNLGVLLDDLKNYPEAEKEYRIAIKINPDFASAHNNLGSLLQDLKNYPEAEKEFRTAIKINPDDASAHNNLGVLLDKLKNHPEAEKEYRIAIKINPDDAKAHYNLGILLQALKNYPEAEKEYRIAIKINPHFASAHYNLGNLLYGLKNYPEAEKEYRTAIEINPDHFGAHINLGILLKDLKNYPEAEKEYRTAIKMNPYFAEVYANLGFLYIEMGKKEEAKKELQKARELFEKQGKEEDGKKAEDILKDLG